MKTTATDIREPMSELEDWKLAAGVEAGLRREFYERALMAESELQEAYADHRKQKAEIGRLRKALERINDPLNMPVDGAGITRALQIINAMRTIAKDALGVVGGSGK